MQFFGLYIINTFIFAGSIGMVGFPGEKGLAGVSLRLASGQRFFLPHLDPWKSWSRGSNRRSRHRRAARVRSKVFRAQSTRSISDCLAPKAIRLRKRFLLTGSTQFCRDKSELRARAASTVSQGNCSMYASAIHVVFFFRLPGQKGNVGFSGAPGAEGL